MVSRRTNVRADASADGTPIHFASSSRHDVMHSCSGIILAGGSSLSNGRFGGRGASPNDSDDRSVLDRFEETFTELFKEIILVSDDPLRYSERDMLGVSPIFHVPGPLTDIHAGLAAASHPWAFVAACDAPLPNRALMEWLLGERNDAWDLVMPVVSGESEPFFGVYSVNCLKPIENQLLQGIGSMARMFRQIRVKRVSWGTSRHVDVKQTTS